MFYTLTYTHSVMMERSRIHFSKASILNASVLTVITVSCVCVCVWVCVVCVCVCVVCERERVCHVLFNSCCHSSVQLHRSSKDKHIAALFEGNTWTDTTPAKSSTQDWSHNAINYCYVTQIMTHNIHNMTKSTYVETWTAQNMCIPKLHDFLSYMKHKITVLAK